MSLPGPLVSSEWLAENLDRVRLVDLRWAMDSGPRRDDYLDGHIPGAVFADLDADLSDRPGERGRHPLPSPDHFAAVRASLGLASSPVVVYDDQSGSQAARLWWMLDAVDHPVAVLDGGLQAWTGELEGGQVEVEPDSVAPVPWPEDRFIEVGAVEAAIAGGAIVVDARSAERFAGQPNPIDSRPGHIPGSFSRPWTDNIGADGRFLAPGRLRAELAEIGVEPGAAVIASCGSGVTGCHDLLAARLAGLDGGRLYTGSWSEWSLDPQRPVAGSAQDEDRS
ncbi:MAG: sulfurtransferase [Acidimicrobiales bacterium]